MNSQNEIVSETNYYPFGLAHKGYNEQTTISNLGENWKFNGVELNEDFDLGLYEMPFRQYDPTIERFTGVDALSEERYWVSNYNFGQNNPILRVDPTGLIDWIYDKDKEQYVWDANVTSADDVDLPDNAEYVGLDKTHIDTHFEENNNWFTRTFDDPDIDVSSFKDYVGSEINEKIGNFIETGESQQLDDIRGLYENFSLISGVTNYGRFKFELNLQFDGQKFEGGYFHTKLYPDKSLNFISGQAVFDEAKWNGKLDTTRGYPFEIKMGNNRIDEYPVHIFISKNSSKTYNKIKNYYD